MASNHTDFSVVSWHKSTHSNGDGGSCVEVGIADGIIPVRDTKHGGDGETLVFSGAAWARFVTSLKR